MNSDRGSQSYAPRRRSPTVPSSTNPRKRPAESQEEAWVADEDRFVLQQAKKKAKIRAHAGRAQPIDLLAVTLRTLDPTPDDQEDDVNDGEPMLVDPEGVFESMDESQLRELEKGIDTYLALEKSRFNKDFWNTMKVICKDRQQAVSAKAPSARGLSSVVSELDRVLEPKTSEELDTLEKQVKHKLQHDDTIDVDYWESLLARLAIHKAKAKLRKVSQSILGARLETLRKQQQHEASLLRTQVRGIIPLGTGLIAQDLTITGHLDPEPFLKLAQEDKALTSVDGVEFSRQILSERRKVLKLGYIPAQSSASRSSVQPSDGSTQALVTSQSHPWDAQDEESKTTSALYEREVARGFGDNEEVFAGEEEVATSFTPVWANKYRPRKPRYFNRVQMGYEWNKYNQTHYDHDNPPPKVVQGYKFNIFYPDLIDRTKAPTYRIERENGRKRGQSFAPAGEEDTSLIRFIAGPPYEDVAFRIIDKEWDFSAKRDRGFKSSFDKGILQLHFGFKKIYYRK